MTRALAIALVAVLLALLVQSARLHSAQAALADVQRDLARAHADAQSTARATERQLVDAAVDAAEQYERGKADAQTAADALLVDLLNRNLSLHPRWHCSAAAVVPATAATAAELNAADEDRAGSASRIVRAAKECDAQVAALQSFIRGEREASASAAEAANELGKLMGTLVRGEREDAR